MRKGESHNFAWIVATSPEQTLNIRKNKITFGHESIDITIGKPSGDDLAKKNARTHPHCKKIKYIKT